jgi:hypothetical protein
VLLGAVPAGAQVIDRVLAIVDGRLVTLSDVRTTSTLRLIDAPAAAIEAALDRWIERLLVLQEVDRFAPPEPAAAAVETRVASVLATLGSPAEAGATLAALGVDEGWLRQWVRDDLRIQSYTDQRFSGSLEPTEEEIENFYREHAGQIAREGTQDVARELVVAARRRALVADWLDGLRRRATIVRPAVRPLESPRGSASDTAR